MAKKVVKKKTARKTTRKSPKKASKSAAKTSKARTPRKEMQDSKLFPIILFIIGAVIIIYAVANLIGTDGSNQETVAATVNGVEITTNQLDTQYAILPTELKAAFSKEMILQQLIDEELLIAHGREQGFSVSEEAVNEEIQRILASGQLTITELQENLASFNLTIEDFENLIERKLMIELSMASLTQDMAVPTTAEAREYYDANQEQFAQEEQVTARHILVASQRDNAAQLAKDLKEQVEGGADFCELVQEETDDKGSVDTCGEYTFPRGFMVPEFEKASFELSPGEVTVVQTVFGYHIIEKIADIPATTIDFTAVQADIVTLLTQQARTEAYQEFLADEKASGDIQVSAEYAE